MLKIILFFFGFSIISLLSCGGGDSPVPTKPKLSSIQANIFTPSCALSSCHSASTAQGNLVLTEGKSRANLVNVAASNTAAAAAGKLRVVPGDPDNSFLVQKLEGPGAGEGVLMPQGSSGLPQDQIDAIREWIAKGALDN